MILGKKKEKKEPCDLINPNHWIQNEDFFIYKLKRF